MNKSPQSVGIHKYCNEYEKPFKILYIKDDISVRKNHVYIALDDSSLISIIKKVKEKNLKLKEI
ncbi:MAG: hypothetical protein CM15mP32_5770 [Flavobacteriaceae bacterium]|nr:MAG: hypothetical protein CM15mP32_5770 [Flavobacteriaceae bacterium]